MPFTLLIAVLLSAQTTDKKVNQVTPELFAKAANAKAMSLLEVDEIKYIISAKLVYQTQKPKTSNVYPKF